MKKKFYLLLIALLVSATQGWAAPIDLNGGPIDPPAVITADVEALDFGAVEVGYPVTMRLHVAGQDLQDNIYLRIETHSVNYYRVSPEVITREEAEEGATVTVTYSPGSAYWTTAQLVLDSFNAEDVVIPISADPFYPDVSFVNNELVQFTAPVGKIDRITGIVRFADVEVPTDPNPPVDRICSSFTVAPGGGWADGYSLEIVGDDSEQFGAMIVKSSSLANLCTVVISYWPHSCGTHEATLKLNCSNAGVPWVNVKLKGESTYVLGDLDGDGKVGISDVTDMIDLLLNGDDSSMRGDMDDDGKLTISDISRLIDHILELQ